MKNKLFEKYLSFSTGSWVGIIIGVVSTPIITRLISPNEYAKFSMYEIAVNLSMTFIIFGIDQSYIRFFYEEKEELRKFLLKNTLKLPLVLYIIFLNIIVVFKSRISLFLFGEDIGNLIFLLPLGILLMMFYRFSILVVRMKQKGKIYSMLQVLMKISLVISTIYFLKVTQGSFYGMILGMIISFFIVMIVSIFLERETWMFFCKPKEQLKNTRKDILKYGSSLAITGIIAWLFKSIDKIFIKEFSTFQDLGIYASASKIVALLTIIQTSFSTFWTPVSYENYEKKPEDKEFFLRVFNLLSLVIILVGIGSIMFRNIIILLLGKEYREAVKIMPFLIFMPMMRTLSEVTVVGINFKKKMGFHLIIALISCGVNIIGNILMVPNYGAKGAAFATAISYIVFFSARTYFSNKYFKVNYDLGKFSFQVVLVFGFAVISSLENIFLVDIIIGLVLIFAVICINFKEIKNIITKGSSS